MVTDPRLTDAVLNTFVSNAISEFRLPLPPPALPQPR
jgi:hypothetical protein